MSTKSVCLLTLALFLSTYLFSAADASVRDEPENTKKTEDNFLVSVLKNDPSRVQLNVFMPKPYLCSNYTDLLNRITGLDSEPLSLRFIPEAHPDGEGVLNKWTDKVSLCINSKFSDQDKRSKVEDKLLVVMATLKFKKDGSIEITDISKWCPADFRKIIAESLSSLEGTTKIRPPEIAENKNEIEIKGRFVQNFGPKVIQRLKKPGFHQASP